MSFVLTRNFDIKGKSEQAVRIKLADQLHGKSGLHKFNLNVGGSRGYDTDGLVHFTVEARFDVELPESDRQLMEDRLDKIIEQNSLLATWLQS